MHVIRVHYFVCGFKLMFSCNLQILFIRQCSVGRNVAQCVCVVGRNENLNHQDCSDTYVGKRQLWPWILGRVLLKSCSNKQNSNSTF